MAARGPLKTMFFSMTLWQLLAWNHMELCFSISPISRTKLRTTDVKRGWRPSVPSFSFVYPQAAIAESPIHRNSLSASDTLRVYPETITPFPSIRSKVESLTAHPTQFSNRIAPPR